MTSNFTPEDNPEFTLADLRHGGIFVAVGLLMLGVAARLLGIVCPFTEGAFWVGFWVGGTLLFWETLVAE